MITAATLAQMLVLGSVILIPIVIKLILKWRKF